MRGLVRIGVVAMVLMLAPAANAVDPPNDGMEIDIFVGLCEDPVTVVQFNNTTDSGIEYIIRVDEIEVDSGTVAADSILHVDVETAIGESHAIHARTFVTYSSEDAVVDLTECESPSPSPSESPSPSPSESPTPSPSESPPPSETTPPPTTTQPPPNDPLPRTGVGVAGFAVAGIGLLLAGTLILRRTSTN